MTIVLRVLYVLICFIPNWKKDQGSVNEVSAPDDGVETPKRVEQFKSKL